MAISATFPDAQAPAQNPQQGASRLSHLLELADQGPALRTALAEEVAELLTHWPDDCPPAMREICESLLARCAREVEPAARARLRVQLYADPDLSARVLPRQPGGRVLVETARGGGNICAALAETLDLDHATAAKILDDGSGEMLATACKGAAIARAAYSALVLAMAPRHDADTLTALLARFDAMDATSARKALNGWRAGPETGPQPA